MAHNGGQIYIPVATSNKTTDPRYFLYQIWQLRCGCKSHGEGCCRQLKSFGYYLDNYSYIQAGFKTPDSHSDYLARKLGFKSVEDFNGYYVYYILVSSDEMLREELRKVATIDMSVTLNTLGYTAEDYQRWYAYLMESGRKVQSMEDGEEEFSDEKLNEIADKAEKTLRKDS